MGVWGDGSGYVDVVESCLDVERAQASQVLHSNCSRGKARIDGERIGEGSKPIRKEQRKPSTRVNKMAILLGTLDSRRETPAHLSILVATVCWEGDHSVRNAPGLDALPEDVSDRKGECRVPAGTRPKESRYHGRGAKTTSGHFSALSRNRAKARHCLGFGNSPHGAWRIIIIIILMVGCRRSSIGEVDGGVETLVT